MRTMTAKKFLRNIFLTSCSFVFCSVAFAGQIRNPVVLFVGPTNKQMDVSESNPVGTPQISADLKGLTASGEFEFKRRYFGLVSIISANGVAAATNPISWNNFGVSMGIGRIVQTHWFQNWHKSIELTYTQIGSPFLTTDPTGNLIFQTATLKKLAFEVTGSYYLTDRLTTMLGLGLLYGRLYSSKMNGTPGVIGGLLRLQLTFQLSSRFFALGEISGEHETYSYSSLNQQSGKPMSSSSVQNVTNATAGIGYVF